ncbi:MAG: polysaccharide deacetylase family protein [Bacteroidota bacterium]|nr:polysaccharide deacetylase family protein [Bacteroidota bacterium]
MLIEQLPVWIRCFLIGSIWRKNPDERTVYLTFDDGPIPEVTPWVLDILDRYQIKATFFCVGENVMKHPEVYQEVLRRGHRTGNHTFNHYRGFTNTTRNYLANVEMASRYIESDLFRPPHGDLRYGQIRELRKQFQVIQWDVVSRDYNQKLSPEKVLGIVKHYARNGSIITFHDSLKAKRNMEYAMPRAIEYLLKEGYTFKTL